MSFRLGRRPLHQLRIGLINLDDAGERFDAEVGERHDAVVTCTVDPDQAILGVHFVGHVPQSVLVLTEHFGDASDGMDMVDLVNRCQGQAAAAAMADAFCVQFDSLPLVGTSLANRGPDPAGWTPRGGSWPNSNEQ